MKRLLRALLVVAAVAGAASVACADRLGLWHVVHDQCVAGFIASNDPSPCRSIHFEGSTERGDAVLKDLVGTTQFLVIPTTRVTGIEDPAVLAPDAQNYFADAWDAIDFVSRAARVQLPRDDLSLAINAPIARSQDQLHIHVDCVRADVRDALHRMAGSIGTTLAPLPDALAGRRYRAMRIDGYDLAPTNPFRVLAASGGAGEMGSHTLVVVGMTFGTAPGFILLDGRADLLHGDPGNGEDLQDHDCAVAKP
jgi:CDP-diacylglycerol pyrophosphatase